MMWKFNVQSAVASAHIAAALLKEGSLLVMTGARYAPQSLIIVMLLPSIAVVVLVLVVVAH